MKPTEQERKDTIEEIVAWSGFKRTKWAAKLLRYVAGHHGADAADARTSSAIHEALFATPGEDRPTRVANEKKVSKKMDGLRGYLELFYREGPTPQSRWRVSLPINPVGRSAGAGARWDLRWERLPGASLGRSDPADATVLTDFWGPFIVSALPTRMMYGEPLFYANPERTEFTRDVTCNLPVPKPGFTLEYPFVTLGDLHFMLDVSTFLTAHGVAVRTVPCLHETPIEALDESAHKADRENVIVVGTPRSNAMTKHYFDGELNLPIVTTETAVVVDGQELHDGPHPRGGRLGLARGVITRRTTKHGDGAVLLVTSNNGRAIQKIGQVLTSADLLAELLGKQGLASFGGSFPDYFQILLEFQTTDLSRYVNSYEVVRAWDVVAERWV